MNNILWLKGGKAKMLILILFQSLSSKFRRATMSWFPWKTLSLLLLVSTAAIINADIQKHGGKLNGSSVGQFLQDIGQYDRVLVLSQVYHKHFQHFKYILPFTLCNRPW